MVRRIRQWMVYKELLLLSRLKNFNQIEPERVSRVLHSFATAGMLARVPSAEERQRAVQFQQALLSIWELSRKRYESDWTRRAKWHLVMACCNSLYERLMSPHAKTSPVRRAAA